MMPMLGAVLTPHPPVLLPEVGKGEEKKISATRPKTQSICLR